MLISEQSETTLKQFMRCNSALPVRLGKRGTLAGDAPTVHATVAQHTVKYATKSTADSTLDRTSATATSHIALMRRLREEAGPAIYAIKRAGMLSVVPAAKSHAITVPGCALGPAEKNSASSAIASRA